MNYLKRIPICTMLFSDYFEQDAQKYQINLMKDIKKREYYNKANEYWDFLCDGRPILEIPAEYFAIYSETSRRIFNEYTMYFN